MYLTPSRRWRKIEQIPYAPVRAGADFAPTDPVLFPVNGVLGISISKALAEEYEGLVGRDDGVSAFERCKVTCRLQFVHFGPYGCTINTRHSNAEWTAIERCKLAKEIGKKVKAYIQKQGLQDSLVFERIYLTRFIRVSMGSWQPELYYDEPVVLSP